ncbi:MAG: DNA mismatch repair protein MutS [Tissierellia bacterium]|nr:DNA mismatch repair protein MutS [Tissierellia bacterium]
MDKHTFEQLSPAMRHYVETKQKNPDAYLFYRMGDFFELFFEDAVEVSKLLDLTLTSKNGGLEERIPMCGVPYKSKDQYIERLVAMGHRVVLCDQVEDPKEAKGLVKREITRIITPGTFTARGGGEQLLGAGYIRGHRAYFAYVNYASGETEVEQELFDTEKSLRELSGQSILSHEPAEFLLEAGSPILPLIEEQEIPHQILIPGEVPSSVATQLSPEALANPALQGLLSYLAATQFSKLHHLHEKKQQEGMALSAGTVRDLELIEGLDGKKEHGLFGVLDHSKTPMGRRFLKDMLTHPLTQKTEIRRRQDLIEALFSQRILAHKLSEILRELYDIERLAVSIGSSTIVPKDLVHLKQTLLGAQKIKTLLKTSKISVLEEFSATLDPLEELYNTLENYLMDDAPTNYESNRFIREGAREDIDELFNLSEGSLDWLIAFEEAERERTGIKNLRVKFNKILGYFLEVSKGNLPMVPQDYIRKQTLVGSERFFTLELKEKEEEILAAKERAFEKQLRILEEIRKLTFRHLPQIQQLGRRLGFLDAIYALFQAAFDNNYVRPHFSEDGSLHIEQGRHPVVERYTLRDSYIPNDSSLSPEGPMIQLITGPNMAGKSTYMRQVALIQILAQMGSFVPAKSASLPMITRVFTRIGASDNLAKGQSTFMVEMMEVADILLHGDEHSLILLDEVGRGTSTYDGLSIAWAIVEYLHERVGAMVLFATHYFELTELAAHLEHVENITIAAEEVEGTMRFLRKVIVGKSNYSYGIDVAKLAGVRPEVIFRAKEILRKLEEEHSSPSAPPPRELPPQRDSLKEWLESLDLDALSPRDALELLYGKRDELR